MILFPKITSLYIAVFDDFIGKACFLTLHHYVFLFLIISNVKLNEMADGQPYNHYTMAQIIVV